MTDDDHQSEIDRNLDFFLRELPNLLPHHRGKFALLRNQKVVGFYDTVADAVSAAGALYPDGRFSVQQVTDVATNLGFYSHAVPLRHT